MVGVNRQAMRSERSTQALLDAAAELIAQGGLASVTLASVGERAGFSRGMVTARFGSKAGLVDALVRRVLTRLRDARAEPADGTGLQRLVGLIEAIRDLTFAEPRDMRALLALMFEALGADPVLRTRMARLHETMRADIAESLGQGVADASIRADVDVTQWSILVVSILRGLAYQWLLDPEAIDLRDAYDEIIGLVVSSVAA
jgi:AcrR family transcriptional regulator